MLFPVGIVGSSGIGFIIIPLILGLVIYTNYVLEKDYRKKVCFELEQLGLSKHTLHIPIYCIYAVAKETKPKLFISWLFSRLLIVFSCSTMFGLLLGGSFEEPNIKTWIALLLVPVFMISYFNGVSIVQEMFSGRISWTYSRLYEQLSFCIIVFPLFLIICCIIEPSILAQL